MRLEMLKIILIMLVILSLPYSLSAAMSDFDDGTLQGWTMGTPFWNPQYNGTLSVSNIGNPGFSMMATDTVGFGGGLWAQAPVTFTGNLTNFVGLSWDEYLPTNAVIRTMVSLQGANNTVYRGVSSDHSTITRNSWQNQFVPFDWNSGLWTCDMALIHSIAY